MTLRKLTKSATWRTWTAQFGHLAVLRPDEIPDGDKRDGGDAESHVAVGRPLLAVHIFLERLVGPGDEILVFRESAEDAGDEGLLLACVLAGAGQVAAATQGRVARFV